MRPVTKDDGGGRVYREYADALDDLAGQIGFYCSYCELPIQNAPEVEHVQPKSLVPDLELEWSNFLLGCKSCNSTKSNRPVDLNEIAFPDADNTFLGIAYEQDKITLSPDLSNDQSAMMDRLIKLVKVHRHPDEHRRDDRPTDRDRRYRFRGDVWLIAESVLADYEASDENPVMGRLISHQLAPARGFFSVWMAVFADHPSMLRGFIDAFPGTATECFDADGHPVNRPGGRF